MRKLILTALVAVSLIAGVDVARADKPENPGEQGLCTAYFNGQKNGHDKHGSPGPFADLEQRAADYTDSDGVDNDGDGQVDEDGESADLSAAENVYNYCDSAGNTIGGNPDHGRYTCILDSDPNTAGNQTTCENNEAPGNS